MKYNDYLKTEHWQETRKKHYKNVLNKVCRICRTEKNLHVHHRSYKSHERNQVLFKETKNHLITLCADCHRTWHDVYKKKRTMNSDLKKIKNLINLGYEPRESIWLSKYNYSSALRARK